VEIPRRVLLTKKAIETILREDGHTTWRYTYAQLIELGLEHLMQKHGITREEVDQVIRFLEQERGEQ